MPSRTRKHRWLSRFDRVMLIYILSGAAIAVVTVITVRIIEHTRGSLVGPRFRHIWIALFFTYFGGILAAFNTHSLLTGQIRHRSHSPIRRDERPMRFWVSIVFGYLFALLFLLPWLQLLGLWPWPLGAR